MFARGLTDVSTAHLKDLLRHYHRGELDVPVTIVGLTRLGFQNRSDPLLETFRGLDAAGVRAVLTAVLAERVAQERAEAARRQAELPDG